MESQDQIGQLRLKLEFRHGWIWMGLLLASFFLASRPNQAAPQVIITEFEAAGGQHLQYEDGATPDWIELQNRSTNTADLAGWTLTEQSRHTKSWIFPATNLPPGAYLVLFASGKDRRVAGRQLHTNFKLPAKGGSLTLRSPFGEESRINDYPLQLPGISFGTPQAERNSEQSEDAPKLRDPQRIFYCYLTSSTPGRSNVDNPLDLYREGRHKARNRLYNLLFEYPEFRQMYLRRLRTVMDELLQPPETPSEAQIIEKRIHALIDQLDPPGLEPSDAALDQAAWPSWGEPRTMREEAERIVREYLPGRRQFLFKSSKATLNGDRIPAKQSSNVIVDIAEMRMNRSPAEQFVCLTNRNATAVDLSGWELAGAGIKHVYCPGTVIPAKGSIYTVSNVTAFRSTPPGLNHSSFVQGDWNGSLNSTNHVALTLSDPTGRVVAQQKLGRN